jgi:hypothetical protein
MTGYEAKLPSLARPESMWKQVPRTPLVDLDGEFFRMWLVNCPNSLCDHAFAIFGLDTDPHKRLGILKGRWTKLPFISWRKVSPSLKV